MPQTGRLPMFRATAQWLRTAVLAMAVLLIAAACSSSPAAAPQPEVITDKGTPFADLLVPKLQASVTDGAIGVAVDSPVTVSAGDGVLGQVSLTNEAGELVDGQLSPDGVSWSSAEPLGYNKQYTLHAQALGLGGATTTTATFETHSPDNLTMPYVLPNDGETVGVGQPIAIRFDENITDRITAQQAIDVTTNPPVEGAFYWLNNREVRWRPAEYWKPGTKVEVAVNAYGVNFGDGLFGQDDVTTQFTIGDEAIATADVLSKGRVIFGAAVGWMEGEFQALNAPFADRGRVSNEYLALLKELWANPTPAFQGEYFQFSDVTFSPMPVQKPHPPIWVGGRSRRGVRRAVEFGDYWHPSQMGPQEVAKNAAYMRRYSASVGRAEPPQLSCRLTLNISG
ncbi:LLM class flavin-dependent oxidoreductase, partial [Mycolicibacterium poriferae]|uniref:LLM class flavin-dependent oxidoreductase n=1 Tax=Mycolicibacterium poriferae TaxID=39694 RepID=UPI0024BA7A14